MVTINIYEELGYSAAQSGNLAMVKFIEQQSPLKQSDIVGAAQKGSIEIMQYYIDKGFNLNDFNTVNTVLISIFRSARTRYI